MTDLLAKLANSPALDGPAVSAEDLRRMGETTTGKLLLGLGGTALLVRYVSAPGERLAPQKPEEVIES